MKTDEKITLWSERIHEFQFSGQTCKTWCQEHHVPVSSMNYWMRKLKKLDEQSDTDMIFAKMPTEKEISKNETLNISPSPVRIFITNAIRIEVMPECPPEFFRVLIHKKAKVGTKIIFGGGLLVGEVIDIVEEGNRLIKFTYEGIFEEILDQLGQMPLPPYITHQLKDKNRYQTVYAKYDGSAAAPTAGLHFTPELLQQVKDMGVDIAEVTLHVGLGTFRPVKVDNILEHHMHSEFYMVTQEAADKINNAKKNGHRVICVGTTSCRTIESAADENGMLKESSGWTEIFIYPGYQFKVLDCLITNFHLPESTLLMLVSALAGREHVLAAYEEAVKEGYRFFSFGDAMMIL